MDIRERAAFLCGLFKGLDLDESTPERKMIAALVETVTDIARELEELSEVTEALDDELADLADHLEEKEGGCCGHHHHSDDESEHRMLLDLQCPACGNDIGISHEMLSDGRFPCPHCGESLEIDDIGGDAEDASSDTENAPGAES